VSLTSAELERGVTYWLATTWPRDFHTGFYRIMADANPHGAFGDAWGRTSCPCCGHGEPLVREGAHS